MMNKCALYIPRPGHKYQTMMMGYVDALRYLGWKVYVCDPKTKLYCRQLIEDYDVRLILTHSEYGIQQLPTDIINKNNVIVFASISPLNNIDNQIDELNILKDIDFMIAHTFMEPQFWSSYMKLWIDNEFDITYTPLAGNLVKAVPLNCSITTDVAMAANFTNKIDIMQNLIEPLFRRLSLLGYSYQIFGDDIWGRFGINYNGPLYSVGNELAYLYASAHVCPNIHSMKQIYLNDRSFMIPLCGGYQISDNLLANKYLQNHCDVADNDTDFINRTIELIENQSNRKEKLLADIEYVANNHTYFDRLIYLFILVGSKDIADNIKLKKDRMAMRHLWEMEARLNASERGIKYGQKEMATT